MDCWILSTLYEKESVVNRKLLLAIAVAVGTTSTAVAQVGNFRPDPNGYAPSMPGGVIADGYRQPVIMTNASAPNYNPAAFQAPNQPAPVAGPGCDAGCGCNGGVAQGCDSNRSGCDGSGGNGCDSGCGVGQTYFAGGCDQGCNDGCGRYLSVFGGWNGVEDVTFNDAAGAPVRASFREGWVTGFAIGSQKTCNRRHELEFAMRDNSADAITTPNGNVPFFGDVKSTSALYNILLEPSQTVLGFKPYAGAGAGLAYIDGDFNDGGRSICYVEDIVFAWQLRAGVTRELNSRVSAFAEYRYFFADDLDLDCRVAGGPVTSSNVDYRAENIVVGINIRR